MADKKVERSGRERPLTPTQKMEASLSDPGTMNMANTAHDKGKSGLVDKYREREERWRREQSLHDQQTQEGRETAEGSARKERPNEEDDTLEEALRVDLKVQDKPASGEGKAKGGAQ